MELSASHFNPANENIKQPQIFDEIKCPYCGLYFLTNGNKVVTDKGIIP